MKTLLKICLAGFLLFGLFFSQNISFGGFWDTDSLWSSDSKVQYCKNGECSFEQGVNLVKNGINDIEKERKLSDYIQDVIVYLLSFITIIGVLYIIYAGFQLMTGGGDEEKMKKAKNIIVYIIIGITIMWLAYSIMRFIVGIFQKS